MMHGQIPAASYAQVVAVGHQVKTHPLPPPVREGRRLRAAFERSEALPLTGERGEGLFNDFARSIVAVIIHDDKVERERRFLLEHAADGIFYRSHAVAHGNNYCSLHGEGLFVELDLIELVGSQQGSDGFQVTRARAFHFYLAGSVAGIYVVELLLS